MPLTSRALRAAAAGFLIVLAASAPVRGETVSPYPDTRVLPTKHSYGELVKRVNAAVEANGMGIVARASATLGAKSIGIDIPGNAVIMVFRPDFAVRMLKASVPAGIEAPLRLYVTEDARTGNATLTYRTPSSVFKPYGSAALDEMARELDGIFAKIAIEATR